MVTKPTETELQSAMFKAFLWRFRAWHEFPRLDICRNSCNPRPMGDLNEFSLPVKLFLKAYPWRKIDPVTWAPRKKPLSECRLALVSTAAFVLPGQTPFDESIRGGDFSFREIPGDADVLQLVESHRSESFDHTGLHQDPNLAFPIDRARELAERGRIGCPNRRHLSFMGSITAPGRLIQQTAPEAARLFVEDMVDVALLVPV